MTKIPDQIFSIHQATKCGSGEAESRIFKMLKGLSGKTWLIACQPNEGDNIYVSGTSSKSQGFGGRVLTFQLQDGSSISLKGPWHSNALSLKHDTGYDVIDKHYSYGIIALKRSRSKGGSFGETLYEEVIHKDDDWVLGKHDRIENIARKYANEHDCSVFASCRTYGGGSSSKINPKIRKKEFKEEDVEGFNAMTKVSRAIVGTVDEAGPKGVASSMLYTALESKGMDINSYKKLMSILVKTGMLIKQDDTYFTSRNVKL